MSTNAATSNGSNGSNGNKPMTKVLIYGGKTGWIGGMMNELCKKQGAY